MFLVIIIWMHKFTLSDDVWLLSINLENINPFIKMPNTCQFTLFFSYPDMKI